jgi:hypothetical protein
VSVSTYMLNSPRLTRDAFNIYYKDQPLTALYQIISLSSMNNKNPINILVDKMQNYRCQSRKLSVFCRLATKYRCHSSLLPQGYENLRSRTITITTQPFKCAPSISGLRRSESKRQCAYLLPWQCRLRRIYSLPKLPHSRPLHFWIKPPRLA